MVGELWRPAGGAYNVDGVLRVMVSGLEEELKARLSGTKVYSANKSPSAPSEVSIPVKAISVNASAPATVKNDNSSSQNSSESLPVMKQGADLGFVVHHTKRAAKWIGRRLTRRGKERT